MLKARGSDRWPIEEATVLSSSATNDFGGPVAEVIYSFRHEGKLMSGTHHKPFLSYESAKEYAVKFSKDMRFTLRVNPEVPITSVVREEDQDKTAMKLSARFD